MSAEAIFQATPSTNRVATIVIDSEAVLGELNTYLGLPASADLYMSIGGGYDDGAFPDIMAYDEDDTTASVILQFEMEGNAHGSFVFPYMLDNGAGRPPRLIGSAIEGLPDPSEIIFRFHAADSAYRISEALSKGRTEISATIDALLTLSKTDSLGNITTVATVVFSAGANTAQIEVLDTGVAVGDRLVFHAPTVQDATLADFIVTFVLIFA